MPDQKPPPTSEPVAVSVLRPCPCALALGKVPARRWRTRAEVLLLLEELRMQLDRYPAEPRTNRELSQVIGLSEHHLVRLFRQTYGQSPAQYRSERRLQLAQKLLAKSVPVAVVAHTVGYASVPTFTRLFVRRFGRTPGEFRALG